MLSEYHGFGKIGRRNLDKNMKNKHSKSVEVLKRKSKKPGLRNTKENWNIMQELSKGERK